jgi:ABC-type nitrate/sulfonate/bicarbonate transport system ATPase subunit
MTVLRAMGQIMVRSQRELVVVGPASARGASLIGVGKVFRGVRGAEVEALRDINLSIREGEFICVIGPSGCGKSTVLRIIAGFESATSGQVTSRGKRIKGPGPDRGVVFQDYGLFPWLTVSDNIAYGPRQSGMPHQQVRAIVKRFTNLVGLSRFADKYPHELSGGMQQRVAIARVLANDPAVLLMDEPFGALDSLTRQTMQEELRSIWQQLKPTVVLVTHNVDEAVYLADRVVVMNGGPSHGVPGHIKTILPVSLEHPRDVTSAEFNALKRQLLAAIHEEGRAVRYLVVANQTATSAELVQQLHELSRDTSRTSFTLLVPATRPSHLRVWTDGKPEQLAQRRAEEAKTLLEETGLSVASIAVGDDSPLRAIERELRAHPGVYEAVVFSTLPAGMSRWLRINVPHEVEKRFDIPVIHVVSQPP